MSQRSTKMQRGGDQTSEPGLGDRLRALRQRNKWSLAAVSAMTGLATSTLSRIENNRLSLTYEKLLQLSRGLGVDLAELFSGPHERAGDSPSGRRAYTPPGQGRVIEDAHHYWRYLCTELTGKKMTPIIGQTSAKDIGELGGFFRHEGEEMVYVISGVLEVHTEFYEPLRIEPGGCIYFDSNMGHAFLGPDGPVTFLSVTSQPDSNQLDSEESRSEALVTLRT